MRQKSLRNWCITDFCTKNFKKFAEPPLNAAIRYFTYQLERCHKTQKMHVQGYIELYDRVSLAQLKQILASPALHAEPRKGTRHQARDYCHKDDSPWYRIHYPHWIDHGGRVPHTDVVELGIWATDQGMRTDLNRVYDLIMSGTPEHAILSQCPREYIKYHSGIRRACLLQTLPTAGQFSRVHVSVYYGETRTGKTRAVFEENHHSDVYTPVWNGQKYWFTDYDGQSVLLVDEFYGQIPIMQMQQLLDNYRLRLEAKGSNPISAWSKIYITSNVHPEQWWNHYRDIPIQVERSIIERIDSVKYFHAKSCKKTKFWRDLDESKKSIA